jgi:folate-binding protein YgfZ
MEPVIVDQSSWGLVRATGADRVRFLQGMVIGDVEGLAEGGWIRTATLNVKGRVMAIFDAVRRGDDFVLIAEPGQGARVIEILSKYAIMDDVEFAPVELAVHRVWSDPDAVWTAPPVFEAPSSPSSEEAVEIRRVEAGLPRYGVDVSDANFPFESTLAGVIDYEKGCYIGQEPVHRVHARGQPARHLRGLRFGSDALPEIGAAVSSAGRDNAGQVSSAVISPVFGAIALATLHRTAADPGSEVKCGDLSAQVVELPFRTER